MSQNGEPSSVLWPVIGTSLFVLTVPGSVVGLIPYALCGWKMQVPFFGWVVVRWLGLALVVVAAPVFLDFAVRFAFEGRGTPAPIAPTRHLVVGGAFRYVRNPGYVAVVLLLLGQGLFFASAAIVVYAAAVALAFHLFVVFYEEPTLRRQFGAAYEAYCREVPRWIPRFKQ